MSKITVSFRRMYEIETSVIEKSILNTINQVKWYNERKQ